MYVILTSKPGKYRAEGGDGIQVVESYEYRLCGRLRAIFDVATLQGDSRLRITEEEPPYVVNEVPTKFLDKFDSLDAARAELRHLTGFGSLDASLQLCSGPRAAG